MASRRRAHGYVLNTNRHLIKISKTLDFFVFVYSIYVLFLLFLCRRRAPSAAVPRKHLPNHRRRLLSRIHPHHTKASQQPTRNLIHTQDFRVLCCVCVSTCACSPHVWLTARSLLCQRHIHKKKCQILHASSPSSLLSCCSIYYIKSEYAKNVPNFFICRR